MERCGDGLIFYYNDAPVWVYIMTLIFMRMYNNQNILPLGDLSFAASTRIVFIGINTPGGNLFGVHHAK